MNKVCRVVVLGVLIGLTSSCEYMNRTYTGIYFLYRSQQVTQDQAEGVARGLGVRLSAFGFSEGGRAERPVRIFFDRFPHSGSPEFQNLQGTEARVAVSMSVSTRPHITIRDYSNTVETDFVRALKGSIEHLVEEEGVVRPKFERQNDFLF